MNSISYDRVRCGLIIYKLYLEIAWRFKLMVFGTYEGFKRLSGKIRNKNYKWLKGGRTLKFIFK